VTITLAWVRHNKETQELLIASDSRLRSRGAIDQAQKIFRLDRGDCCLGFCGDAQVAYPLFVQVGSALNNFIKTRTRAADVTDVVNNIEAVLNNLISSWDIALSDKAQKLAKTQILFAGWSWKSKRFDIGVFVYGNGSFEFHHRKIRLPYPWKEIKQSLLLIGDYETEYKASLASALEGKHGKPPVGGHKAINFDYEPIEALVRMLWQNEDRKCFPWIGGAPQLLKIYAHGNDLPIVIRTDADSHFLLGRRLFDWEKTEYPILDPSQSLPSFIYPVSNIPVPRELKGVSDTADDAELAFIPPAATGC